uniref:Variant surface glycoprotein 1125.2074 n=1 Tax=Trypanosoma brucei TaxID=5691 RepID=A0A1J0R816_9TRYP|nr:variant surface glycoprotein 1125.2074 [Trypanosoma brucei]
MYAGNKANGCGNGATGNADAGKSILADFLCLCTDYSAPESTFLATGNIAQVPNASPHSGAGSAWTAIQTACNAVAAESQLTAEGLAAALSAALGLVGGQQVTTQAHTAYVLGKSSGATGCTGSSDANCINYKTQLTGGTHQIPWAIEVEKAIKDLKAAEKIETSIAETAYQLKQLARQERNHYLAALHAPKEQSTAAQTKKSPTPEESKACEKYNGSQKECPQESCTYDEKENKCKPKKGTETAATGTGKGKDGGNTGKPVCSSFQNQTECEGVKGDIPPGKKAVCGWIEGKCQDSSIIITRKVSLIVSAFVALLF